MKKRYTIQKEMCETLCDTPHPVRLGRNPKHYQDEPFARTMAIYDGAKGYLCEGDVHFYPVWFVVDTKTDEAVGEPYETYIEARGHRDELNNKEVT